jgi:hypothetical protein
MISPVKGLVVKTPKQNCPGCNSLQSFRPRVEDNGDGTINVFISCTACPWRQNLRTSTRELEHLQRNERCLLEQARVQQVRHGTVNGSTAKLLRNVREAMGQAREEAGL